MQVREYRIKKGLTQEDMATLLDITQQAYSRKEKGTRGFSVEELLKLEIILGATINEMFKDVRMDVEKKLNNN